MKLVLGLVMAVMLAGCGGVNSEKLAWAEDKCSNNGGVQSIGNDFLVTVVTCNNGMFARARIN